MIYFEVVVQSILLHVGLRCSKISSRFALNADSMSAPKFMCIDRRHFLRASAGVAGAAMFPNFAFAYNDEVDAIQQRQDVPNLIRNLRPMTKDVVPITDDERMARIAKAQRLM